VIFFAITAWRGETSIPMKQIKILEDTNKTRIILVITIKAEVMEVDKNKAKY